MPDVEITSYFKRDEATAKKINQKDDIGIDFVISGGNGADIPNFFNASATILTTGTNKAGGNKATISIHNEPNYRIVLSHLDSLPDKGIVPIGQPLAKQGNSGTLTTGTHTDMRVMILGEDRFRIATLEERDEFLERVMRNANN